MGVGIEQDIRDRNIRKQCSDVDLFGVRCGRAGLGVDWVEREAKPSWVLADSSPTAQFLLQLLLLSYCYPFEPHSR